MNEKHAMVLTSSARLYNTPGGWGQKTTRLPQNEDP